MSYRIGIDFVGEFPLRVLAMSQQTDVGMHRHDFHELVLVTSGRSRHLTGSENCVVSAGDVFLIKPGVAHSYCGAENFGLINILFDAEFFGIPGSDLATSPGYQALFEVEPESAAVGGNLRHLRLDAATFDEVAARINRLDSVIGSDRPGARFTATAEFLGIVALLADYFSLPVQAGNEHRGIFELGSILGFMEKHYMESIDMTSLARRASVSRATLYRLFVRATGGSPLDYLLRLRLRHASSLLLNTRLPVGEIARRTGFADSNYFARVFRSRFDRSPREFRSNGGK